MPGIRPARNSPATDTEPSIVRGYRLLRYTGLSETANVTFVDYMTLLKFSDGWRIVNKTFHREAR
mgnify:CR=1 FL=1